MSKKKQNKKTVKAPVKVKKPAFKVKRIDDESGELPAEQVIDPFTKKVLTKTVVKDGMVIVEPIDNPFD